MENLEFGFGFGVFVMIIGCIYAFLKGIIIFFMYYFPSNWLYEKYFKGENPSNNFFKAFFCWVITILLLNGFIFNIFVWVENLNGIFDIYRHYNNGMCFQNVIFYFFVFWTYSYNSDTKKISILEEFNFKKKLFNYLRLFSLLFVLGVPLKFADWSSFGIEKVIFLGILIAFLRLKNTAFIKDKT